ncbi:UDP-N-acetylmuramate--L-alanine ligase [Algoriphagus aestuariicola]|jgi:UDP-N-acetylmuramate--alanine ligase|uniref:UDP-N-acetylmuramate--L-alanine ligase n=1 Tax=Algoriphagus aestuariicola TaxID=1852016 RepID=A0ABS3BRY9_9BACT|nr:UDP-N-acetylmuramate--L-alanine ligase [Algoriphagus aestuariicola]MBN7801832.1 UDP-N-acetylmuramate--L-alanine ligase [Algoriphagus aestuariicola]
MMFKGIYKVYFLGIGGIGMSALARWFRHEGFPVAGYDKTPSPLTEELEKEGMVISFLDSTVEIPFDFTTNPEEVLVVWTPAIPKDSVLLNFFQAHYTLKKRSEVLGMITKEFHTIAVAGTHGKTSTSSLVAHLLKSAGKPVAAFLGGITQNYNSNLILPGKSKEPTLVVVEADEFDRSFLRLFPNEAVVTSADPDHLDIYGDEETILAGFRDFIKLLDKKGKLYIQTHAWYRLGENLGIAAGIREYGLRSSGIHAENIIAKPGVFLFDYIGPKMQIKGLELRIPGFHNVENALAAIAIAVDHGATEDQIRAGVKSFRGVKRRFEIHSAVPGHIYIDDYAHHPEEIKACLSSVRAMYPAQRLTVIFQPHLFTRTRDFAPGFSESLSLADEVVLLDIYPARELPISGVTSEMLVDGIKAKKKTLISKAQVMDYLKESRPEVLVTMGAGDIDRLVPGIAEWMNLRTKPEEA